MVSTGRISCSRGPAPTTLIQPSRNENTWMSTIASQNAGTETNTDGRLARALRSQGRGVQVAAKAIASASTTAAAKARPASTTVCGTTSASSAPTAVPLWMEYPKSPTTNPARVCR